MPNELIWEIESFKYPDEIRRFMTDVFEILNIRGQVDYVNGIKFTIHANETNHSSPHVHAKYGEYEISIAIETGEVLVGNLPAKNQKKAIEWVKNNKGKLLTEWNNIAISAISVGTKSMLS